MSKTLNAVGSGLTWLGVKIIPFRLFSGGTDTGNEWDTRLILILAYIFNIGM